MGGRAFQVFSSSVVFRKEDHRRSAENQRMQIDHLEEREPEA
jgi:hypothetical protein